VSAIACVTWAVVTQISSGCFGSRGLEPAAAAGSRLRFLGGAQEAVVFVGRCTLALSGGAMEADEAFGLAARAAAAAAA
jgi:hypothetical protein